MKQVIIVFLLMSLVSCKATKSSADKVQSYIANQIQLDLANKMNPNRISDGFESLGMVYLCTLEKEKNICVFSFDTQIKSRAEILQFFGNEVGVESASKTLGCAEE